MEPDPREVELNFNSTDENNIDELASVCSELGRELQNSGESAVSDAPAAAVEAVAAAAEEKSAGNTVESPENIPLLRSRYPANREAGTPPLENHSGCDPVTAVETVVAGKSYGAAMRSLREYYNYTYNDLEQMTRISPFYLEALENEKLDSLPALVYVIAYIKTLCRIYKVSDSTLDQLVAELRTQLECSCGNSELLKTIEVDSSGAEVNERKLKRILWSMAGGAAVVIMLVLAVVFVSLRSSGNTPGEQMPEAGVKSSGVTDNGNFDPNSIYTLLEPPTVELPKLPVAE